MKKYAIKEALKISIPYLILGGIYILFSDKIVQKISDDQEVLTQLQTYKGWGFVILTTLLLLFYLIHYFKKLYAKDDSLRESIKVVEGSEIKLKSIFENSVDAIGVSKQGVHVIVNPAYLKLFGYSNINELIGLPILNLIAKSEREKILNYISLRDKGDKAPDSYETLGLRKDGSEFDLDVKVSNYELNEEKYTLVILRNITDGKFAEDKINKLNRLYAFISQINQMIVRTKDKDKIFEEVCRIAIDFGKFKMAWIGLVDPSSTYVNPVAFAGAEDGYLSSINKISIINVPEGRGPTGTAIRENRHNICNNIENDPDYLPWRDNALKRGYRSSAALPISVSGKVIGSFNIYSSETNFFDHEEVELLDEVAIDIAYALESIENERIREASEEKLYESEIKYRRLHETMFDCYVQMTMAGKIIDINKSYLDLLGYTREKLFSLTNHDITPNSWLEFEQNIINEQVLARGYSDVYEKEYIKKDGTIFPIEIRTYLLRDDKGNPESIWAIVRDISARKRAEDKLKENEAIFEKLLENSPVYIFFKDENIRPFKLSKNYEQMLNMPLQNILGKNMNELFPSDLAKQMVEDDKKILLKGELVRVDEEFNGRFYSTIKFPINIEGKPTYLAGFTIDITDHKLAEISQKASEERLALAIKGSNDAPWDWDLINNKIYYSPQWWHQLGYKTDELSADASLWEKLMNPEDQENVDNIFKGALKNNLDSYEVEFRLKHKAGYYVPILSRGYITRDREGKPIRVTGTNMDITERKRAEMELFNEKHRLQNILDQLGTPIFLKDNEHRIVVANRAFYDIFCLDEKNVIGLTLVEAVPENERRHFLAVDRNVLDSGIPDVREEELTVKNFTHTIITRKTRYIDDLGNKFLVGSIFDITDRKNVEKALIESETRFRHLFEDAPLGYQSLDADGNIIDINKAWSDVLGYEPEEIIGKWFGDLLTPEYKKSFIKRFPLFKKQGTIHSDFEMFHKDGSVHFISIDGKIGTDLEGDFKQTHCILKDITEEKRFEESLIKSEEKFRKAVMNAPFPILIHAEDGNIEIVNDTWLELTGYSKDELTTINDWTERAYGVRKNLVKEDIEKLYSISEKIDEGEYEIKTSNGQLRKWYFSSTPLGKTNDGRRIVMSMALDITSLKAAEDELRALKDNLEIKVSEKTTELKERVAELERFYNATVDRELRMKELRDEIERLKNSK